MATHQSILLIEDSPGECELFRLALAQTDLDVLLYAQHDAEAAWRFLVDRLDQSHFPSVILLDLQLCGQHGCDFLKRLRADRRFAAIPVVIFTTSDATADLTCCYANGANGYVVKPGTYDALVQFTTDLCHFWIHWNKTAPAAEARC